MSNLVANWYERLDAFDQARVRLTSWYMLGFLGVIGFFTYLVFDAKESAFVRVYTVLDNVPDGQQQLVEFSDRFEDFNRIFRQRVIMFDAGLVLFTGWLSYWLSGKTLQPIKEMLEEQQAFASDVSHGLRTPLTTMQLELDAFLRTKSSGKKKAADLITSLFEEIAHMCRITEGVLSLTRVTHQPTKGKLRRFDLKLVVQKTVAAMQPLAKAKRQSLGIGKLAQAPIRGQEDSIKQALSILLDNAMKYSPEEAKITVNLTGNRSQTLLSVADTGPGLAKGLSDKLFHRYVRGKKAGRVKGTGLGLAIAKKIMDVHRGEIRVKSKEGKGSTFTLVFPKA